MNAKETLFSKIADGTFALETGDGLAKKLRLGQRERAGLFAVLEELCLENRLYCDSRFRYGTAEQFRALTGTLSLNERGFGFFIPDDGSGDLFIPRRALKNAGHGDRVLAFCVGGRMGDEGEILCVLERNDKPIVGVFRAGRRNGVLEPDDRRFCDRIYIPVGRTKGCADGMKAVVRVTDYDGRTPSGEVIEILGKDGDFFVEELTLIRAHGLREAFDDDVLKEAEAQSKRPVERDAERLDLTDTLIITVDGEDTRDIDDAISIQRQGKQFLLGVHIADVSHYVKAGSALDAEAFARGTSVYFPDCVLPMLPPALSNGICSLNEGELRYTLSCLMTVSPSGKVVKKRVVPSLIRSSHRMTYTDVTAIASGSRKAREKYPDLIEFVQTAVELTDTLKRRRESQGGVSLDVKETKILYDKQSGLISIPSYNRTVSHEMIEQFMVLANESVASLMENAPFIYRVHERPSVEKAQSFSLFLKDLGLTAAFDAQAVTPEDYKRVLDGARGLPVYPIVNRVMLRSMMKAAYSPENVGHFGLASSCYCHFTSPIRRYPDLAIHRIIKDSLARGNLKKYEAFVQKASVRSSVTEKNAESAERDVDALYIVRYMSDKIGECYDAVLSGVASFGLFAELDNGVEGLIPIETLPDDSYFYSEEKLLMRGTRNSYRIGQAVRVKVAAVDYGARKVLFVLDGEGK